MQSCLPEQAEVSISPKRSLLWVLYSQGSCIVKVVKVDVCKLVRKEAHASEAGFLTQELSSVSCVESVCLDKVKSK